MKSNVKRKDVIWLSIIFLLAIVTRFWRIQEIPVNITGDEVNFLLESLRIILGHGKGFFALCEPAQQPCFNDYLTAASLWYFGTDYAILGIRFPTLLLSLLSIFPFYFILRQKFSSSPSLVTTLLFATCFWFLNFSRSAWNTAQLVFYLLMFIYLYEKWLTEHKYFYLFFASIFSGLMLYGYHPGKYFLFILALYTFFQAIVYHKQWKILKTYLLSFFFISLITFILFIPQLIFILNNKELFLLRPSAVSIFSIKDYPAYHESRDFLDVLVYQTKKSIDGILLLNKVNNANVENLRYLPNGSPLVDNITKLLVYLGLTLTFIKFYKSNLTFWIASVYIVNILFISIPTVEPPNPSRLIMMSPILYFLVAISLDYILSNLKKGQYVVISLCVLIACLNIYIYFSWQKSKQLELARHPAIYNEDLQIWIKKQIPLVMIGSSELTLYQWNPSEIR